MKYAARMLAIAVTMIPLLASAQLGSGNKLVANVPFQFRAGDKLIPAGKCVVERAGMNTPTLVISNWDAKASLFSIPSMAKTKEAASTNAMVFRKYGNRYFLTGIKLAGSKAIYRLPESKVEAELRAQNVPAPEETLLALLR
jgi:hypothetical protein